jgi:hypothetical protein
LGLATELLKRRQRVLKPRVSLEIADVEAFVVAFAGAAPWKPAVGEVSTVRPGSWNWAKAQDGPPGNL